MLKYLLCVFLTGCTLGCNLTVEINDLPDLDVDAGVADAGAQCLGFGAICTQYSECCSGYCIYTRGNYARCVEASSNGGSVPLGYYERQCQWDRCGGPLPDFNPLFDPSNNDKK